MTGDNRPDGAVRAHTHKGTPARTQLHTRRCNTHTNAITHAHKRTDASTQTEGNTQFLGAYIERLRIRLVCSDGRVQVLQTEVVSLQLRATK